MMPSNRPTLCALMSIAIVAALLLVGAQPVAAPQAQAAALKVFISIDMEGLAGVVTASDVNPSGPDYEHFRKVMAGEANAAVEGAFLAGATEVVVRDSHGGKQNLLPLDLDSRAHLIRGATTGPKNMMEGIDETFGAVVFVGYHARAGTPDAVLAHTSTGNVLDFSINGVSLPEAGYNALVAGTYGVPVVFVAGDRAFVDQARDLLGPVEAVAVKDVIAGGIRGLSPLEAQARIRRGVERAVRARDAATPYTMPGPFRMVLKVRADRPLVAGAERPRAGESVFVSPDLFAVLDAFNAMK